MPPRSPAILCSFLLFDQTHLPYIPPLSQTLSTYHTELGPNGKMNRYFKANKLGTPAKRNPRCGKLGESQYFYSTPELGPLRPLREGGSTELLTRFDRDRCVLQGVTERTFTARTRFFFFNIPFIVPPVLLQTISTLMSLLMACRKRIQ